MSDPALLAYVLGEVALDGREGCTLERLYSFIEEFSKRQPARKVTLDCLFNPDQDDDDEFLTKRTDDPNQYHEAETLDDEAKEKIWEALKADQDFSVGRNNEGKDLSWKEIKEDDTRRRQKRADDNIPDSNDGIPIPPQDNEPETQAKRKKKRRLPPEVIPMGEYEVWRVYTTEEKQWMTLTGHGIDRKKVPPTVFDLLAVIGKCRHAGILQPDLTRAAGQDPRSSSARTTLLADLGYIEKRSVLAARLRTSILTLKRFITPTQAETIFLDPSKAKPKETEQKGQTVDINVLTSEIFRVLGEAKNKTLMHCDLKKKLGMDKDRFHFRAFARMIRRMEQAGYVKRILVPIKLYNHPNARKQTTKTTTTEGKSKKARPYHLYRSRCVRLERDPGDDWADFMKNTESQAQAQAEDEEEADDNASDIEDVSPEQEESAAQQINEALEGKGNAPVEVVSSKPKPDWRLGVPIERITYEKIEASGMSGISSMDLHATIVGPHYYRPLDQVLLRLTKNPYSQPFFLADKRVIRETDVRGRNSHYRYFTHPNHQKLVQSGLAEAPDDSKKKNGKDAKRLDADEANFGDWGFPVFNPMMYLNTSTCGTLADAQRRVLLVEDRASLVGQCRVIRKGNGTFAVDWASQKTYTSRLVRERIHYIGELDYATISFPEMRPLTLPKGKNKGQRRNPLDPFPRRGRPPKPDHLRKFPRRVTRYNADGTTYLEVVGPNDKEGEGRRVVHRASSARSTPKTPKGRGKGKKTKATEEKKKQEDVEMEDAPSSSVLATPTPAPKTGRGRGKKKAEEVPEAVEAVEATETAESIEEPAKSAEDAEMPEPVEAEKAEEETPTIKSPAKKTPAKKTPAKKTPAKKTPAKTSTRRGTKRAASPEAPAPEETPALPTPVTGRPQRSTVKRVKFGATPDIRSFFKKAPPAAVEDEEMASSTEASTPTLSTRIGAKTKDAASPVRRGRARKEPEAEEVEEVGQDIEPVQETEPSTPQAGDEDADDSDLAIQAQLLQEQQLHEVSPVGDKAAEVKTGPARTEMPPPESPVKRRGRQAQKATPVPEESMPIKEPPTPETPRRSGRTRKTSAVPVTPTNAPLATPSKKRTIDEVEKSDISPAPIPKRRTRGKAAATPATPVIPARKTRSVGPAEITALKDLPDPSPRRTRRRDSVGKKTEPETTVTEKEQVEKDNKEDERETDEAADAMEVDSAGPPQMLTLTEVQKPATKDLIVPATPKSKRSTSTTATQPEKSTDSASKQSNGLTLPPGRLISLTGRAVLKKTDEKSGEKAKATRPPVNSEKANKETAEKTRFTPFTSLSGNAALVRATPSTSAPTKEVEAAAPQTPAKDGEKTEQVFDTTVFKMGKATLKFMPPEKNKHPEDQRYGRFGGMLNLSRRQTIMELVDENGGVFPGGIELRHAFSERYKQRNPEAGVPDRRLIVNVLNSLQEAGLLREIAVAFQNSRGFRITKRILVRNGLSPESPQVVAMKDAMIAADGALWWPEGTAIPAQFKNIPPIVNQTGSRQREAPIENVDFDRLFETATMKKREAKAAVRAHKKSTRAQTQQAAPKKTKAQAEHAKYGFHGDIPKSKDSIAQAKARLRHLRRLQEDKEVARQREEAERRIRADAQFAESIQVESGDDRDEESEGEAGPSLAWWADFLDQLPDDEEDEELDMNQLLTDTTSGDFINQHKDAPKLNPDPKHGAEFYEGCQSVVDWELARMFAPEKVWQPPREEGQCAFINLYCPPLKVGPNFEQEPICIAESRLQRSRILGSDFRKKDGQEASERPRRVDATVEEDGEPYQLIWAKKKKPRKRDEEMAKIHRANLQDENKFEKPLNEVPIRERFLNRQRNTFTPDEDLILFCGVTIVRTLFGGLERYINWNLVWKLFPNHTFKMVKQRWPRVRVLYKSHLAVLQADFERLYLEDYEKGLLPEIDENDPMGFDMEFHAKWLKDRLVIPDKSTSESPLILDSALVYGLREEPTDWRETFHNAHVTMGNRFTQMIAQPFVAPIGEDLSRPDADPEIDNVKSLIKSNIITDEFVYDQSKACALLKAVPTEELNKAFHEMNNARCIVPKKSGGKVVPGRNYEFTDHFHNVFKTGISERMFKESLAFEDTMEQEFRANGELSLTQFINDGQMMMVINKFATGQIKLNKRDYLATKEGLITGYRTRMMDKRKLDFQIYISPTDKYRPPTKLAPETSIPPTIKLHEDCIDTMDYEKRINRVWIDTNGKLVVGMWNKARSAIMATVLERPGISMREMTELLGKAFTIDEVREVVNWFVGVDSMKVERDAVWPREHWWTGMRW